MDSGDWATWKACTASWSSGRIGRRCTTPPSRSTTSASQCAGYVVAVTGQEPTGAALGSGHGEQHRSGRPAGDGPGGRGGAGRGTTRGGPGVHDHQPRAAPSGQPPGGARGGSRGPGRGRGAGHAGGRG